MKNVLNFRKLINELINVLLPIRCVFCEKENFMICKDCFYKLRKIPDNYCKICQFVSNSEAIHTYCQNCENLDFRSNHKIRSCFQYDENSSGIIKSLKYFDKTYNIGVISRFLYRLILPDFENYSQRKKIFIPVPMFKKDLFRRKFNQSNEIVRFLFKKFKNQFKNLDIKFAPDLTLKVKKTEKQASLNQKKRMKNLQNAFKINEKKSNLITNNCDIFIVDDVITTMSTFCQIKNEIQTFLDKNHIHDVNIYFYSFLKRVWYFKIYSL